MPAEKDPVGELVRVLANSKIVLSGQIDASLISGVDIDLLASRLLEARKDASTLTIVDSAYMRKIIDGMKVDKVPLPIEVSRSADFKPMSADVGSNYKIDNTPADRAEGTSMDFVNYFRNRLKKIRSFIEANRAGIYGFAQSLELLKNYTTGREVCIIGVVVSTSRTAKGNIFMRMDDETGDAKVMFMNGSSQRSRDLFEKAGSIITDEVIAIKGKVSGEFVYADEIIWPDVAIKERKKAEEDIAIAFMSDIHIGSKRFMEKNFRQMIEWLNGNVNSKHKDIAGKIKYVVMAGDVADGIGVYPGQEQDLAILDVYAQYRELFNFIDAMPDYIEVFVLPGNHDAVQRAEPQPPLTTDLIKDFAKPNVHIVSNPCYLNLHGMDVLSYHGTSLDSIIRAVPGTSYAQPEKAMIELLKRRHLSPVYGGNVIVPSKDDNLVIKKVPDILHMGHIHKNGLANYHGVDIVNSGTWQARTDFQIKQGHMPTPCVMPVCELKSRNFITIDFGVGT